MINRKYNKRELTETVFSLLPEKESINITSNNTIDFLLSAWWYTGKNLGFRLTAFGDRMFKAAEIESYNYPLYTDKVALSNSKIGNYYHLIIELHKKITCPYYIGNEPLTSIKKSPIIRLYDSEIAMLISLYGTVFGYLSCSTGPKILSRHNEKK